MQHLSHRPDPGLRPDVLRLLAQLTVVGDVSPATFQRRVREMAGGPEHVLVVEGGAATLALDTLSD
jgi:hypothetical protein